MSLLELLSTPPEIPRQPPATPAEDLLVGTGNGARRRRLLAVRYPRLLPEPLPPEEPEADSLVAAALAAATAVPKETAGAQSEKPAALPEGCQDDGAGGAPAKAAPSPFDLAPAQSTGSSFGGLFGNTSTGANPFGTAASGAAGLGIFGAPSSGSTSEKKEEPRFALFGDSAASKSSLVDGKSTSDNPTREADAKGFSNIFGSVPVFGERKEDAKEATPSSLFSSAGSNFGPPGGLLAPLLEDTKKAAAPESSAPSSGGFGFGAGLFGAAPKPEKGLADSGALFGAPSSGAEATGSSLFGEKKGIENIFGGLSGPTASAAEKVAKEDNGATKFSSSGIKPFEPRGKAADSPEGGLFGASGLFTPSAASSSGSSPFTGIFGTSGGSSASSGGLFGAGLFGADSKADTPSAGGLFGPVTGGGLFGQDSATGGLFGAAPAAPASAPKPFTFGTSAPAGDGDGSRIESSRPSKMKRGAPTEISELDPQGRGRGRDQEDDEQELQGAELPRQRADPETLAKRKIVKARRSQRQPAIRAQATAGVEVIDDEEEPKPQSLAKAETGEAANPFASLFGSKPAPTLPPPPPPEEPATQAIAAAPAAAEGTKASPAEPAEKAPESEEPEKVVVKTVADFVKVNVEAIYRKRNPMKLNDVPSLIEKYKGKEMQLLVKVCQRYDLDPKKNYTAPEAWADEDKDVKDDDEGGEGAAAPAEQTSSFGQNIFAPTAGPGASAGVFNIFGSAPAAPDSFTSGAADTKPLFGGSIFNAAPATGGLFSFGSSPPLTGTSSSASSGSGLGLFSSPASTGSLFSGSTGGFGLFGSTTTESPPTSAPSSGGLFGASMFGAPSSGGGGLFGAPPSSGSLFGAATSASSLFGAATDGGGFNAGGGAGSLAGLFGPPSTGGGLFGGPPAAGGGLFGAGGGPFGAGGAATPGPFAGFGGAAPGAGGEGSDRPRKRRAAAGDDGPNKR